MNISVVERMTVNHGVVGLDPTWEAVLSLENNSFLGYIYRFLHLFSVLNIIESLHFCYNRVQKEDKSERKEKFLEQVLSAQGIIYNSA